MKDSYLELLNHYKFSKEDSQVLLELHQEAINLSDRFISEFYDYIWSFGKVTKFLKNQEIIENHKAKIKLWFIALFCGNYDFDYFRKLYKIGEVHVEIGLPTHYVNSAFTFVRIFCIDNLAKNDTNTIKSIEKIIDINLDTLTSSYREEELSIYLSMSKIEKSIMVSLKKITSFANYFLATALVLVAFFAIGLFTYDTYLLFFSDIGIEKGILTVLGSLLVLWASIELIKEEMEHLKGKSFAINIFIMLAIAALIRKILIYSLSTQKSIEILIIGGVIVCLAIAYYIIDKKK